MQVLDAIVLIAVQAFVGQFPLIESIAGMAPAVGFILLFLVNVLCLKIAIGKALNSVGIKINISDVAKTAIALGAGA